MKFMSVLLNFCAMFYAAMIRVDALAESRTPEKPPYEPVILYKGWTKYHFPTNEQDQLDEHGEKILEYVSSKTETTKMKYFCPMDKSVLIDEIAKVSKKYFAYEDYCIFETNFQVIQRRYCQREVLPIIVSQNHACGLDNNKGKLYAFVIMICKAPKTVLEVINIVRKDGNKTSDEATDQDKGHQSVKNQEQNSDEIFSKTPLNAILKPDTKTILYKFCFNHETERLVYTWHQIRSPGLCGVDKLRRFRKYTSLSKTTKDFGLFGDIFERMAQNKKDEEKLGNLQHMLVPSSHMVFGISSKSTFHYANVRYMPSETSVFWQTVDAQVLEISKKRQIEFQMFMGDFISSENQAGTFWWKIIFEEQHNASTTIVLHDKGIAPLDPCTRIVKISKIEGLMDQPLCTFIKETGIIPESKLAFCCITVKKHLELFGIQLPFKIHNWSTRYLILDNIESELAWGKVMLGEK